MSNTWSYQTPSPVVKFEQFESSPAETFMSTPANEEYSSLFDGSFLPGQDKAMGTTMNPLDIMTPESTHADDRQRQHSQMSPDAPDTAASTPEPGAAEKKTTKKRKSWGQVLPEPKTNLPPRKRAKTEDEKEQRRVERVLRNRRAAQSSRERKRLEVEGLEKKNQELEAKLKQALQVIEQLSKGLHSGMTSASSTSFEGLRPNPITLSPELFNSQDGHMSAAGTKQLGPSLMDDLFKPNNTVNPASISPTLAPVPEQDESSQWDEPSHLAAPTAEAAAQTQKATSTDSTQLPAAKLCSSDLQCRSADVSLRSWLTASMPPQEPLWLLILASSWATISLFQHPLMQVVTSIRAGRSLPPTPAILNTVIWMVTTRRQSTSTSTMPPTSTSASSSTTTPCSSTAAAATTAPQQQAATFPSPSLRLRSLRKILSCSPRLARPLSDATSEVLRWVKPEGAEVSRPVGGDVSEASADGESPSQSQQRVCEYLRHVPEFMAQKSLPSFEVLMALRWAIQVEMARQARKSKAGLKRSGHTKKANKLKTVPRQRGLRDGIRVGSGRQV